MSATKESIEAHKSNLEEHWDQFSSHIKDLDWPDPNFGLERTEPQQEISFSDLSRKFSQTKDYIASMALSENFEAIPRRSVSRVIALISEMITALADAITKFDQALQAEGFSALSEELVLSTSDNVLSIEVGGLYRLLFEKLDNIIYEYSVVSHFIKIQGTDSFFLRKLEVDRIVGRIEEKAFSVEKLQGQLTEAQDLLTQLNNQYEADIGKIENSRTIVEASKTEIDAALTDLQTKIESTDADISQAAAVTESASELQGKIEAHDEFIISHRTNLEELQANIGKSRQLFDKIVQDHQEREEQIKNQMADADRMLQGATIAGLAGEFGSIKNKLEDDLKNARHAVYWSTFFLFVSVLPIAFYVFGPLFGLKANGIGESDFFQAITNLAMRAILLIPATWFARFSARRHDRIFRLREHYSYKYSLATAVEGFKKQAPDYQDDIAAETFYELTFNPADRLDPSANEPRRRRESLVLAAIRKRFQSSSEDQN